MSVKQHIPRQHHFCGGHYDASAFAKQPGSDQRCCEAQASARANGRAPQASTTLQRLSGQHLRSCSLAAAPASPRLRGMCVCWMHLQQVSSSKPVTHCRLPPAGPLQLRMPAGTALPGPSASAEACLWRHEAALAAMLKVLARLLQGRRLLRAHEGLKQLLKLGIAGHRWGGRLLLLLVLVLLLVLPRGLQQVQQLQLLGGQAQPRPAALHLLSHRRRRALRLRLVQHPRGLLVQVGLQHRVLQQVEPRGGGPLLLVVAGGLARLALGLRLLLATSRDQVRWQASPHARVPRHGHCPLSCVAAASRGLLVGCRLL